MPEADTYKKNKQYVEAEPIYVSIAGQYPNTDYAFSARKNLAWISIALERWSEADLRIEQLRTDYSGHSDLAKALLGFSSRYMKLERYAEAKPICQALVANYPNTDYAFESEKRLFNAYFVNAEYSQALSSVDALATNFSGHSNLPEAL